MIMRINVPPATGYQYAFTNAGEVQNKGFEIMLGFIPVKSANFKWDVSANFSTNKNKLNKLIQDLDQFSLSTTNSGAVEVVARLHGGLGDIMATTYKLDAQGRKLVDASGLFIVDSKKKFTGNYQPDWIGGITNTITYKDLTLRFLIDGHFGGKLYSGSDAGLDQAGVSKRTLHYRDGGVVINGVLEDGSPNTKSISAEQYWQSYSGIGENYVYDQTNVRLREVSLVFQLPQHMLNKTFIKGASVGVTGRNLFFIYNALDNFDPEGSFSVGNVAQGVLFYNLPTSRSLGFNVNIKF
jgi:hypothetical protein